MRPAALALALSALDAICVHFGDPLRVGAIEVPRHRSASFIQVRAQTELSNAINGEEFTDFVKSSFLSSRTPEMSPGDESTPSNIAPLDLHAIRDLLLLGKAPPLLLPESPAYPVVKAAAQSLADMLPEIHPVPSCRVALGNAGSLEARAAVAWSCLGLNKDNFTSPYDPKKGKNQIAGNTGTKFDDKLGACSGSLWPRACSFWASFHAMGVL